MAYALAIIRYRRELDAVVAQQTAHRAYLAKLKEEGTLLASGPFSPRFGGALLLRVSDDDTQAAVDRIRDNDPYIRAGVAQYEILIWEPGIGKEELDRL
jgi:uncharacterized protein YciI